MSKYAIYQIDIHVIKKNRGGQEVQGAQWCWAEDLLLKRIASDGCSDREI